MGYLLGALWVPFGVPLPPLGLLWSLLSSLWRALGALLGPTGSKSLLGPMAAEGFDEVLEEPGLEEGSVGDLLFFNRIFED